MSAEVIVKKRGRPRKISNINTDDVDQNGETTVSTPKRSTKTRSINTTDVTSKVVSARKSTRSKKISAPDDVEVVVEVSAVQVQASRNAKNFQPPNTNKRSTESRILGKARAFEDVRSSTLSSRAQTQNHSSPISDATKIVELPQEPLSSTEAQLHPTPPRMLSNQSSSPPKSDSTQKLSNTTEPSNVARSSFLSSFLSDTPEPKPQVPESSKISDRSAFSSTKVSIDDIISGTGVSDLKAMATSLQDNKSTKPERKSAIPITAPKSYKSHNVTTFPDRPQQQHKTPPQPQRTVSPESYSQSSFQNFKSKSLTESSTPSPSSSSTNPTTKQSPQIPPTGTITNSLSKPASNQTQKSNLQTSSSPSNQQPQPPPPPPPQPTPASNIKPSPSPSIPPSTTPPTPATPSSSRPQPNPSTLFRPKRPTEMTPAELLKNPEFKSLRRKYTGLIVGIPVLVVTSYVLWKRMDVADEVERSTGGDAEQRVRGQMPRRILDDGGLERGK